MFHWLALCICFFVSQVDCWTSSVQRYGVGSLHLSMLLTCLRASPDLLIWQYLLSSMHCLHRGEQP